MRRMRKVYFVISFAACVVVSMGIGFYIWQNNFFLASFQPPNELPKVVIPPVDVQGLTDENLESELITGMKALGSSYEAALGLRIAEYYREYTARGLSSPIVESLNQSLVEKNGPCWSVREGECRE